MTFKEQVEKDIDAVFLNLAEFGEIHNVQGKDCAVILTGDTSNPSRARLKGSLRGLHGLASDELTVFMKTSDIASIPAYGNTFRVDGRLYVVDAVSEDMGILTIRLKTERAGGGLL